MLQTQSLIVYLFRVRTGSVLDEPFHTAHYIQMIGSRALHLLRYIAYHVGYSLAKVKVKIENF